MIGCVALFFVERFIDRLVACVALLMMSVRQQVNSGLVSITLEIIKK